VYPSRLILAAFILLSLAHPSPAADWPQVLGPSRNGASPDRLADTWPAGGPPVLWSRHVGQGFSGPVVVGDRLILFHRVGNEAVVECLDAATGAPKWTARYPTDYRDDFGFDEGPRATPAVADGRVYTFGAEGLLACWKLEDGAKQWAVDTRAAFHADKGFFGVACSPLVEGDRVVLNVGGREGAGVVAFDRADGAVRWKATNDEAGYASPIAATINGRRLILSFNREGLVGLDPADGKEQFRFRWRSRSHASVNAATPLAVGDEVFLSASYGTGAVLLRFEGGKPREAWSGDDILSNHYATSVYRDGFLYGFDGRQEQTPRLRCVEWATGKVRWTQEDFGAGTILVAGNRLVVLTEKGELVTAPATPDGFKPLARGQILKSTCRAYPALAGRLLYARDQDTMACVDLRRR
jgi:outer membrane protein assembly factor BamB